MNGEKLSFHAEYLRGNISHNIPEPIVLDRVDSTSTYLKALAENGAPPNTLVIAHSQSSGRGRVGKSFLSPRGGLYMSLLLRPGISISEVQRITPCAAVAAAEVIEEELHISVSVKWVNDLYYRKKKVCGILTEAPYDRESGGVKYVIVGIGINLFEPEGGFGELSDIAGALLDGEMYGDKLKLRLAAALTDRLLELTDFTSDDHVFGEYKKRLFLIGRDVMILRGNERRTCRVISLERDYSLVVSYPDGVCEKLISGEISIIPHGNS